MRTPKWTKKDFEFLADTLAEWFNSELDLNDSKDVTTYESLINIISFNLHQTNSQYDADKFLDRCRTLGQQV